MMNIVRVLFLTLLLCLSLYLSFGVFERSYLEESETDRESIALAFYQACLSRDYVVVETMMSRGAHASSSSFDSKWKKFVRSLADGVSDWAQEFSEETPSVSIAQHSVEAEKFRGSYSAKFSSESAKKVNHLVLQFEMDANGIPKVTDVSRYSISSTKSPNELKDEMLKDQKNIVPLLD